MPGVSFLGRPDPVVGWDGTRAYVSADVAAGVPPPSRLDGLAAGLQPLGDGTVRVFRDRLGLGKLFWTRDAAGRLLIAARPAELVRAGHALDAINALPRDCVAMLGEHASAESLTSPRTAATGPSYTTLEDAGARIRSALDQYLAAIAAAHPGRRAYVCLSGGLDSSTIAVVAQRHFPSLTAVSFDLTDARRGPSEDRIAAQRLAAELDLPLIECDVTVEALLSFLDTVLVAGIDWRDFNVHCGLVNAALADAIARDARDAEPPLVITGDLPNEFLVDYHAETYRGATYYALPRLAPAALRQFLIDGLDTCHREVGVFGAFGLTVIQPYAVCVDTYLSLPADFLALVDRKDRLVRAIVGDELPDHIYRRPKVRAQIGSEHGGGTLAACVDNGVDAAWLRRRFALLHRVAEGKALDRFIRAGRYRACLPVKGEQIHAVV
jgi:asparagine synthetase B (glutamine-hydrolysing)